MEALSMNGITTTDWTLVRSGQMIHGMLRRKSGVLKQRGRRKTKNMTYTAVKAATAKVAATIAIKAVAVKAALTNTYVPKTTLTTLKT
jgi:hypothetical protein